MYVSMYEFFLPRPTHSDIKTVCTKKKIAKSFESVAFTDFLLVMSSMMIIEIDLARDQESPAISLVSSGHFWASEQKLWALVWQSFAEAEQKLSLAKVFCDVTSGGASLAGNASIVLYNRSLIRHFVSAPCIRENRGIAMICLQSMLSFEIK